MSRKKNAGEADGAPVFAAVARRLEREIREGKLADGKCLPTDEELARQMGISRYAAREAYSELVRKGFVRRVKRLGTIVTFSKEAARLRKVGLILISDVPSFYLFEQGVKQSLIDHDVELRVRFNYNTEAANLNLIEDMLAHGAQALIIAPPPMSSHEPYRNLLTDGVPVVLALDADPGMHCVYPDDHEAGRLLGDHFGMQGFQHPAVVTDDADYARLRTYGFREGLAAHKLTAKEDRTIRAYYATEKGELITDLGRAQVAQLLKLDPRPDAVFAVNDMIAISIYYWLLKAGLRVPDDIAVAGVDYLGPRFHPFQLTSVDIGITQMGREAANLLLNQFQNPALAITHKRIAPQLMIAASTARRAPG